jgi:mRNA interferase MazF
VSTLPFQWSVFSVDLDPVIGSEQAGRRPVIVISREVANISLPVVTVIPLTRRKPGRRVYPNEALLPGGAAGLTHDSVAMAHQLHTLSKQRLGTHIGRVNEQTIQAEIQHAIRTHLDLD